MEGMAYEAAWQVKQKAVTWLCKRGLVESFSVLLRRQLDELGITHVLDVGANRGQFGKLLRRIGYEGEIISFEPIKEVFAELRAAASKDPRWSVHNFALGERTEEIEINVTPSDDFSSLLKPNQNCAAIFAESTQRKEVVTVRRLDEALPSIVASSLQTTHLKLDTQGFDLNAMRGAGALLDSLPSLQTELSIIGLYEGQPSYIDVLGFLDSKGFTPSCIYPVSRRLGLPVVEFDGLFCRNPNVRR